MVTITGNNSIVNNATAATTTDIPTWEMAVIVVGGFLGLILIMIFTYTTMIFCQLTTSKRLAPKKIFGSSNCCSQIFMGIAERILRCCCCCDPKVVKALDSNEESLVSDAAINAGLLKEAGGQTNAINFMKG